jgi:transposase
MHDRVCPPRRMRFSFESRCRLVSLIVEGTSPQAAAAACGASRATGYRLWRRFQEGGWSALVDRPPVPKRQPRRLSPGLEQRILAARQYANAGPLIVAGQLGLPASTVWKVLRRHGRSRLPRPLRGPVRRYERSRPGELVHVDIKKLGRFRTLGKRILGPEVGNRSRRAGRQFLHIAIDDTHGSPTPSYSGANRLPPARPSSAAPSAASASRGSSPNGSSRTTETDTAPASGAQPAKTSESPTATRGRGGRRPTGKQKRRSRPSSANRPTASPTTPAPHRTRALPGHLRRYNRHRPTAPLGGQPPISRVSQVRGSHI